MPEFDAKDRLRGHRGPRVDQLYREQVEEEAGVNAVEIKEV